MSRGTVKVFDRTCAVTAEGFPDWDADPMTGYRWPEEYCFDVPLTPRTADPVEVKYVWELNRLVYLLPIAAHAAFEGDHQLSQLCRAHLRDWICAHPSRQGVHWRSGIELAIRILVFVLVMEMTSVTSPADPELEEAVSRSVAEHAGWIERFPSRYSSANNHRIAELTGMLIAASAYPEYASTDEVDRWWSELESTALLQFHNDGVPTEQATMYGFLVLEWLVISLHLARRGRGRVLAPETRGRIQSAAGFLAAITDAAGNAVRFGDDDDSRLMTAARPPEDLPRTILDSVASALDAPSPSPGSGLSTFADGGYTVWRSGSAADEVLWVLDHGPLGMGHLAAHAHADTLAVYLHLGGRPVLVDAGTYLYHSPGGWRDRLRRTAEHNTVAIGVEDSSVMAGPFNWRRGSQARGRLTRTRCCASQWSVAAQHRGYVKRYGVVHRRVLEGMDRYSFRLTDQLENGSAEVNFRWSLLVAPELDVVRTADGWMLLADGTDLLKLTVPAEWQASARVEQAWCSPDFGRLEPTCRLVIEGNVIGETSISVTLMALTGEQRV